MDVMSNPYGEPAAGRNDVIGEVTKIYWSWNFNGSSARLFNPLEWVRLLQSETRWERIGLAPS